MALTSCEYNRVWRDGRDNRCGQTVGLRTWYDAAGLVHAACAWHDRELEHRYPSADPPEPEWLPESADPITAAKAELARFDVTDPRDTESWSAA